MTWPKYISIFHKMNSAWQELNCIPTPFVKLYANFLCLIVCQLPLLNCMPTSSVTDVTIWSFLTVYGQNLPSYRHIATPACLSQPCKKASHWTSRNTNPLRNSHNYQHTISSGNCTRYMKTSHESWRYLLPTQIRFWVMIFLQLCRDTRNPILLDEINSLTPGRCESTFTKVLFKVNLQIDILSTFCEIGLVPRKPIDAKSVSNGLVPMN